MATIESYRENFTPGRIVKVISGDHVGAQGVVQSISRVTAKPLQNGKVRVWLDGFSCIDIFDFDPSEIELIPYDYKMYY